MKKNSIQQLGCFMAFSQTFWDRLKKIGAVAGLLALSFALNQFLQLSRIEFLQLLTLVGLSLLVLVVWTGFEHLGNRLQVLSSSTTLTHPNGNPKKKKDTTGAGAAGGMIVGAMLGLAFGPAGVIVGGLIGAIIGDEVERDS